MGRILAIDYGLKRTGLAVTDPMQIIASGLTALDNALLIPFLTDYISKESVDKIVIGYPLNLDGSETHITSDVEQFINKLNKLFPSVIVIKEDERFTSKMAVRALIDSGVKKMKRRDKKLIDKMSAVLILQSYLEHKEK